MVSMITKIWIEHWISLQLVTKLGNWTETQEVENIDWNLKWLGEYCSCWINPVSALQHMGQEVKPAPKMYSWAIRLRCYSPECHQWPNQYSNLEMSTKFYIYLKQVTDIVKHQFRLWSDQRTFPHFFMGTFWLQGSKPAFELSKPTFLSCLLVLLFG